MRRKTSAMPFVLLVLAACGACSDGNNHTEPLDKANCDESTLRLTVAVPGDPVYTVSETDTNQWFCFSDGTTLGLDSEPGDRTEATITDQGSLPGRGMFSLFVLPADTPLAARVVDEAGDSVLFAQTGDGDHLLLIDVAVTELGPELGDPMTFTMLDADGNELLTLAGNR